MILRCPAGPHDHTLTGRGFHIDARSIGARRARALIGVSLVVFFARLALMRQEPHWRATHWAILAYAPEEFRSGVVWALRVFRHEPSISRV